MKDLLMNKYIFFTFNDFSKHGGGVIRMYGILNSLAELGKEVTLISNATNYENFHSNIKHIYLDNKIDKQQKRFFQFCIGVLPNWINKFLFKKHLNVFKKLDVDKNNIIFFEYLDNSFGYLLRQENILSNYIDDIHGLAVLEFKYKKYRGIKKLINNIKAYVAKKHDKKVYKNAKKLIAVSNEMKSYLSKIYKIDENKICVLRDGINESLCNQEIDQELLDKLTKQYKNDDSKIVLFAGNFKDLGGVDDLVKAFLKVLKNRKDVKLLLIGDGEHYDWIKNLVEKEKLEDKIILLGRVPYNKLRTYQEIADVMVCPDKNHPYSHMVPHIKYYDSLISGKPVINGSFDVIKNINQNEELSLMFVPSNIEDLSQKIIYAIENNKELKEKYKHVKERICKEFTYKKFVENFLKSCKGL